MLSISQVQIAIYCRQFRRIAGLIMCIQKLEVSRYVTLKPKVPKKFSPAKILGKAHVPCLADDLLDNTLP